MFARRRRGHLPVLLGRVAVWSLLAGISGTVDLRVTSFVTGPVPLSAPASQHPLRAAALQSVPHRMPIVCLGDSLTQGVGASVGHDYPSLLSKALGTPVVNAGVDGDETGDALKRLETDVLAKDPGLVIVELGANDFLDGQPIRQAFANLEEIVRRVEANGSTVVLVGIPPSPLVPLFQQGYNQILRHHHVTFIPTVLDDIVTNPRLKSADHLHPNDQGYLLIAQRIQQVVEPLLKQNGIR